MNKIEKIIKVAIEGNYTYKGHKLWHYSDTGEFRYHQNGGITIQVSLKDMVLDPLFWKALGKSLS